MEEVDFEMNKELAIDIVMNNIAVITKEYSCIQDKDKSTELREKINVLNKIKDEIYLGNLEIINKVIEKNRKGIL